MPQAKEEVELALADQSGEAARVDEENTMLKAQLEQVTGTLMEEQAAKLEANRHLSQVQLVRFSTVGGTLPRGERERERERERESVCVFVFGACVG
jgi:hypothetical protein